MIVIRVLAIVFVIGLVGYLLIANGMLGIQCSFAEEQTRVFFSCRDGALKSSHHEAAGYLQYVVAYYPSGTKQDSGSRLDIVVERVRKEMIRQIIADLRTKTGRDLGDDPQKWIDVYNRD